MLRQSVCFVREVIHLLRKLTKHLITLYALLHIFNWFIRNVIFKWKHPSAVMRPIYYSCLNLLRRGLFSYVYCGMKWYTAIADRLRDAVIYILSDAFNAVIWCIYNAFLYIRLFLNFRDSNLKRNIFSVLIFCTCYV